MSILPFSLTSSFPDHDPCFGSSNSSSVCQVPTPTMINFLNISNPNTYLQAYCLNPPVDSCAFGYCPNPDVASPAVRFSTYFTTIVSAILVLYSPENVASSFYAQLLNVYSLIFAAIIAIGERNLTKVHSVIALCLAASPMSAYLFVYVIRSLIGDQNRLGTVFGKGMWLNRCTVLVILPLWLSVLGFTARTAHFQQRACDRLVAGDGLIRLFFIPFLVFFDRYPAEGAAIIGLAVISWAVGIYRKKAEIWGGQDKKLPLRRIWRKVVDAYPFIEFCTVVLFPHAFWILNIEVGIMALSPRESFSPTYGQLLAIFVTVPPAIQLCLVLLRVPRWFMDLTWVRYVTCRRNKPRHTSGSILPQRQNLQQSMDQYSTKNRFPSSQSTLHGSCLDLQEMTVNKATHGM
ncbi:hypothetical protein B0H10DRAFT_1882771 [Mycena sp. CBHHK59/15]|nr:hypothetical protein B0H10DRAFT_1882771 [Mycena sp. CBHHK59/15]